MKTNRRGFFGVFAGLLSAIGIKGYTPVEARPFTMTDVDWICEELADCELVDSTVTFWTFQDGEWIQLTMYRSEYDFWHKSSP